MLGQPMAMLIPEVVGFELTGKLPPGATATDLVLTVTQMLRKKGVVDKFVEFYGAGLARALAARPRDDREHGARVRRDDGLLPGRRRDARVPAVHRPRRRSRPARRALRQGEPPLARPEREAPVRRHALARSLDRRAVARRPRAPAGPRAAQASSRAWRKRRRRHPRRQGRRGRRRRSSVVRTKAATRRPASLGTTQGRHDRQGHVPARPRLGRDRGDHELHEHVEPVGAASPPACSRRRRSRKGLRRKPWVKTSLAPGSQVVTDYLTEAGLMTTLEKLGFYLAGYGCTTCIGNSGPLHDAIAERSRTTTSSSPGALGQSQLRGPRESGRARELPRVAAARRRLRARRHDGHRLRHRAARHRHRRQAGLPARHLAGARRGRRARCARRSSASSSTSATRTCSRATPMVLAPDPRAGDVPAWTVGNRPYPVTAATATGGSGGYAWSATRSPAGMTVNPVTGAIVHADRERSVHGCDEGHRRLGAAADANQPTHSPSTRRRRSRRSLRAT